MILKLCIFHHMQIIDATLMRPFYARNCLSVSDTVLGLARFAIPGQVLMIGEVAGEKGCVADAGFANICRPYTTLYL